MLKVDNINVGYEHTQILHGLSFSIEKGSVTALLGGNGAGKTTTLKSIAGLLPPRSGSIKFDGQEISRLKMSRIVNRGLVLVHQERELFTQMKVLENLELGATVRRDGKEIKQDIERMYELFPILRERKNMYAGYMSGGEQQMLAIARGLMARPKLLMLDEPSAGLAPIIITKIGETINILNRQGLTILLVEQNVRLALTLAGCFYVLGGGEIVHDGQCHDTTEGEVFDRFIQQ